MNANHQAGNKGPQGRTEIHNGKISVTGGMGTFGGSQWLQVSGFDGQAHQGEEMMMHMGKELFPMVQKQVELPLRDVMLDIKFRARRELVWNPR